MEQTLPYTGHPFFERVLDLPCEGDNQILHCLPEMPRWTQERILTHIAEALQPILFVHDKLAMARYGPMVPKASNQVLHTLASLIENFEFEIPPPEQFRVVRESLQLIGRKSRAATLLFDFVVTGPRLRDSIHDLVVQWQTLTRRPSETVDTTFFRIYPYEQKSGRGRKILSGKKSAQMREDRKSKVEIRNTFHQLCNQHLDIVFGELIETFTQQEIEDLGRLKAG